MSVQLVVKIVKVTTLLSAVLTTLCSAAIFGFQFTFWFRTGVWEAYPLASAIKSLEKDQEVRYVTASAETLDTEWTTKQMLVDWLLGIPTTAFLLVLVAAHLVFYLYLVALEKSASRH